MQLEQLTPDEIRTGIVRQKPPGAYCCLACGAEFVPGEVYPIEGRFYEAHSAAEAHLRAQHPGWLAGLIRDESKYNNLTDNQAGLMELFAAGMADKDIAKQLGVSVSTVRHQKFQFREKAKAARFYLAVYEGALGGRTDDIAPVHRRATGLDERYVVSRAEREKILDTFFEKGAPLRLKGMSTKEKKKLVILARIAEEFAAHRTYTEREVNQVLAPIYEDTASLRRYLVDYGFMRRTRDGSSYELTS